LTETTCDQKIVISAEPKQPFEERIAARKTIVYETLVDPIAVKIAAENLKGQLFPKHGLFKTKPEEVKVVSVVKYYKPYIMVSGEYTIYYYRKRVCTVKVSDDVCEVLMGIDKFKPKQVADSFGKVNREIELRGEERVKKKVKASLVLDELGRDVSLKELPSAPSERNPEEVLSKSCTKVPPEWDLNVLRTRIFKRPTDVSWIANELFEVNERAVIYVPVFKVIFRKVKTGQEKTYEFDGLAGKIIPRRG
jgi:hypothetical protein